MLATSLPTPVVARKNALQTAHLRPADALAVGHVIAGFVQRTFDVLTFELSHRERTVHMATAVAGGVETAFDIGYKYFLPSNIDPGLMA